MVKKVLSVEQMIIQNANQSQSGNPVSHMKKWHLNIPD